jgi:hypothetical protein
MVVPRFKFLIYLESSKVLQKAKAEGDRSSVLQRYRYFPREFSVPDRSQTSDLILMILDATKKAEQRALLEGELEAVGIRLNREPP